LNPAGGAAALPIKWLPTGGKNMRIDTKTKDIDLNHVTMAARALDKIEALAARMGGEVSKFVISDKYNTPTILIGDIGIQMDITITLPFDRLAQYLEQSDQQDGGKG
jgi:hypothetical protein